MPRRLLAIVRKEGREVLRDPVYLVLAIAVPLVVLTLLGLGFVLDVKHLPVAVYDLDRSPASRTYTYAFTNSEYFSLARIAYSPSEVDRLLQSGTVRAALIIPSGFSRTLDAGRAAAVQVLVDGSFASRALIVTGYVSAVHAQLSAQLAADYVAGRGRRMPAAPIAVEGRVWFNPSLETKNSIVPGLLVIFLMFYPGLLAALVVVREKERGTIFNLYCSPVRRWEVILAKALPYLAIACVDYVLLLSLSLGVFGVRFVGSLAVLTTGAVLYVTCCVGVGLVISVLCRTQVAAILCTFVGMMTPSILFSGLLTPVAGMPAAARAVSRVVPAAYFMGMTRGVFLKGLGFSTYLPDFVSLAVFACVAYSIAIFAFRKQVV